MLSFCSDGGAAHKIVIILEAKTPASIKLEQAAGRM